MVIEHHAWENTDKIPGIVFDSQVASVFWKERADSLLVKIKNGDISLEDFSESKFKKMDSIFDEMYKDVKTS